MRRTSGGWADSRVPCLTARGLELGGLPHGVRMIIRSKMAGRTLRRELPCEGRPVSTSEVRRSGARALPQPETAWENGTRGPVLAFLGVPLSALRCPSVLDARSRRVCLCLARQSLRAGGVKIYGSEGWGFKSSRARQFTRVTIRAVA
jgi:hypothetical protein